MGILVRMSERRRFFLQVAVKTGRREQDVRASKRWDMDVTSFAVPYGIYIFCDLLENHDAETLSTKVPTGVPPLQEIPHKPESILLRCNAPEAL